jgi:hypothetical protein
MAGVLEDATIDWSTLSAKNVLVANLTIKPQDPIESARL